MTSKKKFSRSCAAGALSSSGQMKLSRLALPVVLLQQATTTNGYNMTSVVGVTYTVGVRNCATGQSGTLPGALEADGEAMLAWRGPCGDVGTVTLLCDLNTAGQLTALYEQSASGGHLAEGRPVKRGCSRVSYRHTGTSKCCFPGPTPPPTPAPPAPAPLPSNGITFEVGDQDCLTKHNGTISSSTDPNGEAAVAWRGPCGGVGTVTLSCAFNIVGQLIAFYEQSAGSSAFEPLFRHVMVSSLAKNCRTRNPSAGERW
jgi:hypothetical protein